jgi:hypothetical protein
MNMALLLGAAIRILAVLLVLSASQRLALLIVLWHPSTRNR